MGYNLHSAQDQSASSTVSSTVAALDFPASVLGASKSCSVSCADMEVDSAASIWTLFLREFCSGGRLSRSLVELVVWGGLENS